MPRVYEAGNHLALLVVDEALISLCSVLRIRSIFLWALTVSSTILGLLAALLGPLLGLWALRLLMLLACLILHLPFLLSLLSIKQISTATVRLPHLPILLPLLSTASSRTIF